MSTEAYGHPETRARILTATRELIAVHGARLKLSQVAQRAGVSRQALYLHFGDRQGLLLALVAHMDQTLQLGESLAHVHAAPTGAELLRRAMQLNTEFWAAVRPVAQVLEAAQYHDEALGAAWRDRMRLRRRTFAAMIERLAERGELADAWTPETATALLYAVAHFDTWRELTEHLGFSDDAYAEAVGQLLCRALLAD
ncbi:MAG: TetR/AcrR family transcriptional regulator [Sandaracinaceae bacterium]